MIYITYDYSKPDFYTGNVHTGSNKQFDCISYFC